MALTVEATVALAVARPSARTNSLKPRDTHTESTTALVANCPCPVVNCPCRTPCALLYTALSLVCLAVTSAGRLPKSAPPGSSRSAAAHPVEVRMSTRCRAASKRDMHASILRTCSAGTPIQTTFVPVRTCVTGPLRWAAAHSHAGLLLEHPARNVPLQRRSLKLCALAAAKKVVDIEAQKLVCSHTCTCVRRHARASACE